MKNLDRNFIGVIVATIIVGAIFNFIGLVGVGAMVGATSTGGLLAAVLLSLVATGAVNYLFFIAALRKHFQKEAEQKLDAEIRGDDLPRRFDEVNF